MIKIKHIFIIFAVGAGACAAGAPAEERDRAPVLAARQPIAEEILHSMTLEEKVGQCFVVAGNANFMNEASAEYQRLRRLVAARAVGGIIWYRSKVYETAVANAQLQSLAKIPLLIAADLEAGMGMRFDDTPWAPWPMALAATGEPALAEALGRLTAEEARAIGVHQIYAPVADVNINPKNPVINTRSFGEDPEDVARFAAAFVRGCEKGGGLATVKHFPGHGDTEVDSHRSLPVLRVDRARLDRVELLPFRRAFAAGCRSVMIAHLAVPALDPEPAPLLVRSEKIYGGEDERERGGTLPATVSRLMVEGVLRKELGFDGLVVTDAMDMGGLADHFDVKEGAIRALLAGCDQILKSGDPEAAIDAVAAAVRGGRIPLERLDASVRRIINEKIRLGLFEPARCAPPLEVAHRRVASPEHDAVIQQIAERSVTLVREAPGALPLREGGGIAHVLVTDDSTSNVYGSGLKFQQFLGALHFVIDPRSTPAEADEMLTKIAGAEAVVVSLNIKARTGAGRIEPPPAAARALAAIEKLQQPVIAVSFGSPYVIQEFPRLKTYIAAYSSAEVSQRAAAAAIFGKVTVGGRLPVSIPGVAARGHGIVKNRIQ